MNDLTAIGVARAFHQSGLRIPQDISVIGFDKTYLAEYFTPSLTTVDMHADLFGEIAADSLYDSPARTNQRAGSTLFPWSL